MNSYRQWFAISVWAGMAANFGFIVPALFAPVWFVSQLSLPVPNPTVWLRDAAMLLFFLTMMYYPAALDPWRYRVNSVLLVLARLGFAVFWLAPLLFANGPRAYLIFGLADLAFGVVQGALLILLFRSVGNPAVSGLSSAPGGGNR